MSLRDGVEKLCAATEAWDAPEVWPDIAGTTTNPKDVDYLTAQEKAAWEWGVTRLRAAVRALLAADAPVTGAIVICEACQGVGRVKNDANTVAETVCRVCGGAGQLIGSTGALLAADAAEPVSLRAALIQARARIKEAIERVGETETYHTQDLRNVVAQCDVALATAEPPAAELRKAMVKGYLLAVVNLENAYVPRDVVIAERNAKSEYPDKEVPHE